MSISLAREVQHVRVLVKGWHDDSCGLVNVNGNDLLVQLAWVPDAELALRLPREARRDEIAVLPASSICCLEPSCG